jgi:histidinol dehydrogenase
MEESIQFCNEYATEHLLLKVKNPDDIMPKLLNAGEILIGEMTPSSFGNFGIGINHVLPTGGNAHTYSCTSVWDFLKRTSLSRMTPEGFNALKDDVTTICDYEGFPAHGNVIHQRKL